MTSVSNAIRPLLRFRISSVCIPRRYATSSSSSTAGSSKRASQVLPSKSKPSPTRLESPAGPGHNDLEPEQLKKQWYATKLYQAGQRVIFRPKSHTGILAASYVIAGSCLVTSCGLAFNNIWAYQTNADLHWIVGVAWRLGIITFTVIGGLAFLRPTGMIKSIDLVSRDGVVKLLVEARPTLPFLRPKSYTIAPYQFEMDRTFVQQLDEPEFMYEDAPQPQGIAASIGRTISKAIWYPFAATRRLVTNEGFMHVQLATKDAPWLKLDTQGTFSNDGRDLLAMGTLKL
ncbi:uncharacterized protein Z518_01356 [Rhinocladiella mackenziei CBS 650.93]|uniref:Uncharacterized protein n=1 Tax=Rhinocladiella mackenziei CBS 650.93 TaxID=1442369 RepID=A0A0D2IW52_9EURO|nr:uncharacterized protein Z518_01356 [Rhinocladiella mackenziei CBS 650.93]KIX10274.1 hypothetical protein Z518_01356 [Rhinocladiella mackenziei CBS 650.93]